jgi:hypothetical protein
MVVKAIVACAVRAYIECLSFFHCLPHPHPLPFPSTITTILLWGMLCRDETQVVVPVQFLLICFPNSIKRQSSTASQASLVQAQLCHDVTHRCSIHSMYQLIRLISERERASWAARSLVRWRRGQFLNLDDQSIYLGRCNFFTLLFV